MKFIIMVVMLSSLLLAWPKQIILGSYKVKSNAANALVITNKKIEEDAKLQALVKEHSLKAINTVIGNYTVVSVNEFNSYVSLLRTYKVLRTHYADAFVLKYPTKNIMKIETIEEIEDKASEEIADEAKRAELKKFLEEQGLDSDASLSQTDVEAEANTETSSGESLEQVEVPTVEEVSEVTKLADTKENKEVEPVYTGETDSGMNYLMYLIGLAVLILIAAVVVKYRSKSEPKREIKTLDEDA